MTARSRRRSSPISGRFSFGEDAAWFLDGAVGDPQPLGDTGVGTFLGHQRQHFALPRAEHRERVVAPAALRPIPARV